MDQGGGSGYIKRKGPSFFWIALYHNYRSYSLPKLVTQIENVLGS